MPKRIGILTGGGDCPGLNAVIRAVVKHAQGTYGWEVGFMRTCTFPNDQKGVGTSFQWCIGATISTRRWRSAITSR